jgi:predicted protein tyrosine phosphatase
MIASVKIMEMSKALHVPYKEPIEQTVWITTIDPEDKTRADKLHNKFSRRGVKHFSQFFRDWSDEDEEQYIKDRLEFEGPREQHINNIISFLDPFVASSAPHHLGVNCFAGMSRSTAIGIIAWVMQGKAPKEALRSILDVRPVAWPNLRMLKFASNRLGVDIFTPVKEWKDEIEGLGLLYT